MAKFLILTANQSTLTWTSLDNKLAAIKTALNSGKGADWLVDIQYKSATPTINKVEEKIDTKWLQEHIKPFFGEYDMVALHFSEKQSNAWGIRPTLRGSNPQTNDDFGDFYFSADEDSKRMGFDRFVQVCLHETSHEFFVDTKQPDITHEYHSKHKDITNLYKTFDWSKFQARRQGLKKEKKRLQGILEALQAIFKAKPKTGTKPQVKPLLHPVEKYKEYISREYGVEDWNYYPQTGRHIGTDFACPVGTPVLAPYDGEVTVSGTSPALGNFCHYKYTFDGVTYVARFMHLTDAPEKGKYKRGEIIELSGKTGKVSGPHLHVDIFYNDVRLDLLTAKNWNLLTLDPIKHYV